ncbi:hypothetical protein HRI_004066100 [Hibiscus trionum]|uniref:Uncharacterized protein n=1 Tax=Hibiscus trionum TaxID=183268 RepID=A0A9W7MJ86_HIBTR|nr:hypothetical protein HRI_004066100 [Hibiscus trionum]
MEKLISKLKDEATKGNNDPDVLTDLELSRIRLWELVRQEERAWLQKSRLKWFEAGDRNLKFFHILASTPKMKNCLANLMVGEKCLSDSDKVQNVVECHFRRFYNEVHTLTVDRLECNLSTLNVEAVDSLDHPFLGEEIWSVLKSIDGSKAFGLDGFNMKFLECF